MVCMALKTLQCCGYSSSPEQRNALRAYTPSTTQTIASASSGGRNLFIRGVGIKRKASCGTLGGRFRRWRPWLWRLWCQLCFIIRLLKLSIKKLKLVICNQFLYVLLYLVKHIAVRVSLIVAWWEPKLCSVASPNHFSPMEPRHIGHRWKALVIVRTILTLYWGRNIGIMKKTRTGCTQHTYDC